METSQKLAEGISLGELATQVNNKLLDLKEVLRDTPCLVFNPISGKDCHVDSVPLVSGQQQVSRLIKLSETELVQETVGDFIYNGYVDPNAVVAPIWKSDRNAMADSLMVGRSNTCDIRIKSNRVSKVHAWIRERERDVDGQRVWKIIDNYSTNGTRINGVQLDSAKEYQLRDSHEIIFGTVHCVFLDQKGLAMLCSLLEVATVAHNETRLTLRR